MKLASDNVYFISDTHFSHKNICRGVSDWSKDDLEYFKDKTRDFDTLDQMNQAIVNNINDKVGADDILFHLGDWSFGGFDNIKKFRDQINCKTIHLVTGNHDHHVASNTNNIRQLFSGVTVYQELDLKYNGSKHDLILMHYPLMSWNRMNKGSLHLFGHVHSTFIGQGRCMDVGMDSRPAFEPYSFQEILNTIGMHPVKSNFPNDHHVVEL